MVIYPQIMSSFTPQGQGPLSLYISFGDDKESSFSNQSFVVLRFFFFYFFDLNPLTLKE